jgi:enterochelin esterase family protein
MTDETLPDPLAQMIEQLRASVPGIPEHDLPRFIAAITSPGPYAPCEESVPREGVPAGAVTAHRFTSAVAYPGVERDVRLYLPHASLRDRPLALLVFQDGAMYLGPQVSAPVVLDNLIATGDMPPCVALFVEPGETGPGLPVYGGVGNRSVEYDSLGDTYARFLIDELVPALTGGLTLIEDPAARGICGLSSGGICAFNAAWERPDYFGKVISHCGSFVDIRGGHALHALVRRAAAKPLRVFLQSGERDLDILFGCWPLANRELASALEYRGYDHRFVMGEGGHSLAHGGALFAETLRWLWRDWRESGAAGRAGRLR